MRWLGFGVTLLVAAATCSTTRAQFVLSDQELESAFNNPNPEIRLPLPSGELRTYRLSPTQLLPNDSLGIRDLAGPATNNPAYRASIVLTRTSLSAALTNPEGTFYLNSIRETNQVRLTVAPDRGRALHEYQCLTSIAETEPLLPSRGGLNAQSQSFSNVVRTFRISPAATAEFTQFHGSKEAAILEVVTAISRASGIFHRELGISFRLIDQFERMIFTNPVTDPYSSNDPSEQLLHESQHAFDDMIGTENYDVGILLIRGPYGLAYFSSVCDPARKGSSCIGLPEPAGDAFHVNLVTHELGHQFGAKHTFNSPNGLCAERRDGWTSFEPGTGSTIMSYSSLPCTGDSFQPRHDAYFHSETIKQILDFVNSGLAHCAQSTPRENRPPSVNAGPEYTIPTGTPFVLTATGSDPEGDTIFFNWEQRDLGPARALSAPDDGQGPLFRSMPPSIDATRMFPRLELVLAGTDAPEERLPTKPRTMRFRALARDSHDNGAINWSDTQLQVVDKGAPFKITSHNNAQTLSNRTTLTWNVASTDSAPISATHVRITLSTNGGQCFSIVLTNSTPNDGSEEIVLPEIATSDARMKIEPINNIFFDINDAPLSINPPVQPAQPVRLTASHTLPDKLRISWPTIPGTNYVLQRSNSIPTNRWLEVLNTNAQGSSVSIELSSSGNEHSFYRVIMP